MTLKEIYPAIVGAVCGVAGPCFALLFVPTDSPWFIPAFIIPGLVLTGLIIWLTETHK